MPEVTIDLCALHCHYRATNDREFEETLQKALCGFAISKVKKIRQSTNRPLVPSELFEASEYLMSFRGWITDDLLRTEAMYRDHIENNRSEGMSVSAAESKANVSPEYRALKYLKRVDSLAEEQILLVKKYFDRMGDEKFGTGGI